MTKSLETSVREAMAVDLRTFASPPPAGLPVPAGLVFAFDLLQRQPPKGWGIYRVPNSDGILISKPNGDGVVVLPASDPLLYELASAMLPPAGGALDEVPS